MTRIYLRLCYLCYQAGENEQAVGYYMPKPDETYDVCEECAKLCEKQGHIIYRFEEGDEIEEFK